MKSPEQALEDVRRRLDSTWHLDAAHQGSAWPHSFALGSPDKAALEADFEHYQQGAFTWKAWAAAHGVAIIDATRIVFGTKQRIPTHLVVPDVDTAVRLTGRDWVTRLERGRARAIRLAKLFPAVRDLAQAIRDVDRYSTVDFDLLCEAAAWFSGHSATGLTPRQVPVPGLHAKWLNTHQSMVATLAGVPALGLLPPHPARLHVTYLDPDHRSHGSRRHDSATVGDMMSLPYTPTIVVISENKDTALHFPELPAGVSVEGMGRGGRTAAAFPWLRQCPNLFYWGDMDAYGFEILNDFREAGIGAASVLMDRATYERYEPFGTRFDANGKPLDAVARKLLPHLSETERQLYDCLTDPSWTRYRRVEQEKIPLSIAAEAVQQAINSSLRPR